MKVFSKLQVSICYCFDCIGYDQSGHLQLCIYTTLDIPIAEYAFKPTVDHVSTRPLKKGCLP